MSTVACMLLIWAAWLLIPSTSSFWVADLQRSVAELPLHFAGAEQASGQGQDGQKQRRRETATDIDSRLSIACRVAELRVEPNLTGMASREPRH